MTKTMVLTIGHVIMNNDYDYDNEYDNNDNDHSHLASRCQSS